MLAATFLFDGLDHGTALFDARLARDGDNLELPDLGPESRIFLHMHVVDTATGLCRGLRSWTLSPATSMRVAEIVQRRLASAV